MEDRLISEQEFADMMGWKISYARKLRYDGKAPERFVQNGKGGAVSYWLSDVRAWLADRTHSTADPSDTSIEEE